MATSRPVRIPRRGSTSPAAGEAQAFERERSPELPGRAALEHRPNRGGSQRAVRLTTLFLVLLAALYLGFVLYGRTAPGGTSSAAVEELAILTGLFALFALVGALVTLTPAPREVLVAPDRVIVVGRWGRRRTLPTLSDLTVRVARRYSAGWLASVPVALVEVWGKDTPVRTYLADEDLFAGAESSLRGP